MGNIEMFKVGDIIQTEILSEDGHGVRFIEGIISEIVGDRVRIISNTGELHITLIDQLF